MINLLKWTLLATCVSLILLSSCKSAKSKTDSKNAKTEDFDQFYSKFHKDGTFQISRLKYPLKGHNDLGKKWTKNNWMLMKGTIYDVDKTQFKVEYKKTDTSFYQKVWIDGSGFKSEHRFELIEKKWYLVSAVELNN